MRTALQHPRYHFDRWIAAGGMGEVWQATDTLLDREVAVKVLRREYAQDPVLRARFAAEARHAGSLQHSRVASVLDYGELTGGGQAPSEEPPLPFLVMELVDGQPLSGLLADGQPLAPEVAAELIAQAADGIEAAHGLGIVHRDVKPGNLLVTATGQVKVTDFGVARAADTVSLTETGHVIGTPHYLSPEQAEGGTATAASDVYSLGIVLFECLTGRKPFAGDSPVATALMQIRDPLPPFPPGVPERLQDITRVATAKNPSARFRSAGAMAAALRDESPVTRTIQLPPVPPAGASAAAGTGVIGSTGGGRRLRLAGAAVLALLLIVGGAWALAGSTGDQDAAAAPVRSNAPDQVRVRADDYVGLPVDQATRRLEALGLHVGTSAKANPDDAQPGTVAGVTPAGLVDLGARIVLSVWSKPPPPPPVSHEPAGAKGAHDKHHGPKHPKGGKPGPSKPAKGPHPHGAKHGKGGPHGHGKPPHHGGHGGGGKPHAKPGKGGKR